MTWANNNNNLFQIGGRRIGNTNSPLPFDSLQVQTKVQVQNCSYFPPYHVLPLQTINVSPPSDSWTFGCSDVILVNTDNGESWLQSGLKGCNMFIIYLICTDYFGSGHHIVQLWLIFCAIPSRNFPSAPGTDLFLTYVWHFNFIPQLNPAVQALSTQKDCTLTHQQECMSWNTLDGVTEWLLEMLCHWNDFEPS
jgi:hypothetical protein